MGPLGKRIKGVAKMDAKSGEMAPIFDENFGTIMGGVGIWTLEGMELSKLDP